LLPVNFATTVVGSKKTQTNGGEILKFRWVPFSVWAFSIVTPGIPTHYLFFTKKIMSYLLLLKGQQGSPLPIFLFSLIRESTKEPHIQEEKGGGGRQQLQLLLLLELRLQVQGNHAQKKKKYNIKSSYLSKGIVDPSLLPWP
jgi:hypothetical protein